MVTMFTVVLFHAAAAGITPTVSSDWVTYSNTKYHYTSCYPLNMRVVPQISDDGEVFRDNDGGKITVWRNGRIKNLTLSEYTDTLVVLGGQVISKRVKRNQSIQVSTIDQLVFWQKTYKQQNQYVTLEVRYRAKSTYLYESVIQQVNRCFKVLPPPKNHLSLEGLGLTIIP